MQYFKRLILAILLLSFGLFEPSVVHSGCSGGDCGGGGGRVASPQLFELPSLQAGHASVVAGEDGDENGYYGWVTLDGNPACNLGGYWFRVVYRPGWEVNDEPTYTEVGDTITAISFSIREVDSERYYFYEITGSWEDSDTAAEQTKKQIPLTKITSDAEGEDVLVTVTYNNDGVVTGQDSQGIKGSIRYGYSDSSDPLTLNRLWAGSDPNDYANRPSEPTGGRWVDLDYDSQTHKLTSISHGCGSCGLGDRDYNYLAAVYNLEFDPSINENYDPNYYFSEDPNVASYDPYSDPCNFRTGHYLQAAVTAADGSTVLVSYDYDDEDRRTGKWLGSSTTGLQVYERLWTNQDANDIDTDNLWVEDPNNTTETVILRRYVNPTQFRVELRWRDTEMNSFIERDYHSLQSGNTLSGDYSESITTYEKDDGMLEETVTRLPNGNKVFRSYDANGNVTRIQRGDYYSEYAESHRITEAQYSYTTKVKRSYLASQTNAYGGRTSYTYDAAGNMTQHREPEFLPCGESSYVQQTTTYTYDTERPWLLVQSQQKDASGNTVTTKMAYDVAGNMTGEYVGWDEAYCDGYDCDPNHVQVTTITYNVYNEPVVTTHPNGSISKRFYSNSGALVGEGLCVDGDCDAFLHATVRRYNADGWLTAEWESNESGSFSATDLMHDIDDPGAPTLSWVRREYRYDDYGRRTAVIEDAGGAHLVTSYQYNHQSEVTHVTHPDGRTLRTVRDGRGLVTAEIWSYDGEDIATTQMAYDANGNLIERIDPEGVTERYVYDEYDHQVRAIRVGGE